MTLKETLGILSSNDDQITVWSKGWRATGTLSDIYDAIKDHESRFDRDLMSQEVKHMTKTPVNGNDVVTIDIYLYEVKTTGADIQTITKWHHPHISTYINEE